MAFTILGMYQYNDKLFDEVREALPTWEKRLADYPENMAELLTMDFSTLVDRLLIVCGEFEPLYSNWDMFKMCVGVWARVNALSWQRLYDSCNLKYNPIWNVDGKEVKTETETRDLTRQDKGTVTDDLTGSGESTNTGSVSAYNSSDFQNRDKNVSNSKVKNTNVQDIDRTYTDTGDITRKSENIRGGNIGVTMTQQLIEKEREVALFSLYDTIVDSFKKEFCVLVY